MLLVLQKADRRSRFNGSLLLTNRLVGLGARHASAKTARSIRATASSEQCDDESKFPESSAVASSESEPSPKSAVRTAARSEHASASAINPADAPANGRSAELANCKCAKYAAVIFS